MPDIVFAGGPHDGRRGSVSELKPVITAVYSPPVLTAYHPPRPPWWRHPLRWFRWTPPPPPPEPEVIQLTYRDAVEVRGGRHVYEIDGDWPWFKGPDVQPVRGPQIDQHRDLYQAVMTAAYAVHPLIRHDPSTRWVMDLDWYRRLRAQFRSPKDPGDPDAPPDPDDCLLGVRITVTDDGGAPHLENRRFPADWPNGVVARVEERA